MKTLKIKVLEIIILITICISLVVILIFAKNTLNKEPELSNSNQVQNYSTTRHFKYNSNITDSYIYQIPFQELINTESSTYNKFITSTDNIINTYTEKISIRYTSIHPEQDTIIKNFCNTYDIIELEYKFQCSYSKNVLILQNQYKVNEIKNDIIKNNHQITITIPIKKNTRLNEYLKNLNNNNITTTEVDKIE